MYLNLWLKFENVDEIFGDFKYEGHVENEEYTILLNIFLVDNFNLYHSLDNDF